MKASVGDQLLVHGRTVGQSDHTAEVIEVMGEEAAPLYRVRYDDGHETIMSPGPDTTVRHVGTGD
ncbi:DUF1918 domain-containing protein [Nocardia sp. NPDC005746]|uniref:DUF1918 domain-containing protein n=1 Tax=unclassified Nocardia TaxID=2637762 RepID=UPI0033C0E0B5